MKKRFSKVIFLFSLLMLNPSFSQKKKDIKAIKNMCGCYEITFRYAETFKEKKDSTYVPSKPQKTKALEWVELVENSKNKIILQHLLIVGKGKQQHVIKHWRQDWIYQNTDFYIFDVNNQWNYISKPKFEVKGQWTQKVFQVDDSPRYEQTASWVHVDGKSFWESEVDAPLPRRENEIRNDYNVLHRRNRHEITDYGWLHEQDNDKILRSVNGDILVAQEKGYNTYKKVDDDKCKTAREFWNKEKNKWALVRAKWNKIYAKNKNLKLKDKMNDSFLYEYLFDEDYDTDEMIGKIIDDFVEK